MDDEPVVDEEGEEALYEYLFGHEAAVSWEGDVFAAQGSRVAGHLGPKGI